MVRHYPSFQTLDIADQILEAIADRAPGYQGRIGVNWYWQLPGGILVTFILDFTTTEQRWDVIRAEAVSPSVGIFNAAEFPFKAYGTLATSPPFIHDLEGEAEWSNRLYFQMGHLIEDAVLWLKLLHATIIDPQVRAPATFPDLNRLEREMVAYALDELNGHFRLKDIYPAFEERISQNALSRLARKWEEIGLLTQRPRRVTVALRALVDQHESRRKRHDATAPGRLRPPRADVQQRFAGPPQQGILHALQTLAADVARDTGHTEARIRMMEIGCGTGRWLAELADPARQCYGLDPSGGCCARPSNGRPPSI